MPGLPVAQHAVAAGRVSMRTPALLGRVVRMHLAPKTPLNNGVLIDALGFGVYKVPADDCAGLVSTAVDAG